MIVTSRSVKYYKVEMTDIQADTLTRFLRDIEPKKLQRLDKICSGNDSEKIEVSETLCDLLESLEGR